MILFLYAFFLAIGSLYSRPDGFFVVVVVVVVLTEIKCDVLGQIKFRRFLSNCFNAIIIYHLTARVFGATQMISQSVSSIFLFPRLPSGTWRTPGLSIPCCCIPTSSPAYLVFFPLSLRLARWFWPDLMMNGRHDHTTAVCVTLRWSAGLRVVRLPAGSWHGLPRW